MYKGTVTIEVYGLSNNFRDELETLLDSLALVPTEHHWDNVDWVVLEANN